MNHRDKPADRHSTATQVGYVGLGLALLLPAFFSDEGFSLTSTWVTLAFGYILTLFWLASVASSLRPRPVLLLSLLYLVFGLLLPALYQVGSNRLPWPSTATDPYVMTAGAILLSSFVGLAWLMYRVGPDPKATKPPSERQRGTFMAALAVACVAIALALPVFMKYGPRVMFGPVGATQLIASFNSADKLGFGLTFTLARGVAVAALAITLRHFVERRSLSITSLTPLAIAATANLLVNFPTALPRFQLLALLAVVLLTTRGRWLFAKGRLAILAAPAAVYMIFPIVQSINRGARFQTNVAAPEFGSYMYHGDFDGFQSAANAIAIVQADGLTLGHRLLSAALFFVPRAIWPMKSGPTGAEAAQAAGYHYLNISMPLPGELYCDFGWAAVLVGAPLVAWAMKALDQEYERGLSSAKMDGGFMIAVLTAAHAPILWRGSLLSVIAPFASACGTVAMWAILSAGFRQIQRPYQPPARQASPRPM